MKSIFNALKNIRSNLAKPAFKPLDPNPNTMKKLMPDAKVIKNQPPVEFEDYIDGVFRSNPHLSEKEMYEIYHTHKKAFDNDKLSKISDLRQKQNLSDLLVIKDKLSKATNKKEFKKFGDEFINIGSKIRGDK